MALIACQDIYSADCQIKNKKSSELYKPHWAYPTRQIVMCPSDLVYVTELHAAFGFTSPSKAKIHANGNLSVESTQQSELTFYLLALTIYFCYQP